MFKHILLPTDGSALSEIAVERGMVFAKSIQAKVTGLCVVPKENPFYYDGYRRMVHQEMTKEFKEQARTFSLKNATTCLEAMKKMAQVVGVLCEVVTEEADQPFEAITQVAEQKGCDLIMMASHGRRGVGALLIGSETQKVLTHSKIPVLVYR